MLHFRRSACPHSGTTPIRPGIGSRRNRRATKKFFPAAPVGISASQFRLLSVPIMRTGTIQ